MFINCSCASNIVKCIKTNITDKVSQINNFFNAYLNFLRDILNIYSVSEEEKGKGIIFVDEVTGGNIPREYMPSIKKGFEDAMKNGPLANYPISDIKVVIKDN